MWTFDHDGDADLTMVMVVYRRTRLNDIQNSKATNKRLCKLTGDRV